MLRNVERLTGQPSRSPRSRRPPTCAPPGWTAPGRTGGRLLGEVDDALEGRPDAVRAMIAGLAAEHDLVDVAAAAVRLAAVGRRSTRRRRRTSPWSPPAPAAATATATAPRAVAAARRGIRPPKAGATRLFVNAGRASGVRPQDIVGALANESNLYGPRHRRDPDPRAARAGGDARARGGRRAARLRGATTLKGRKANIRRDRDFAPSGGPRRGGRHD